MTAVRSIDSASTAVSPELLAEPAAVIELLGLEQYVHRLLYTAVPDETLNTLYHTRLQDTCAIEQLASPGTDPEALRLFHAVLYRIYVAHLALPWEHEALNVHHPLFAWILRELQDAADSQDQRRIRDAVSVGPTTADEFCEFLHEYIRRHRSSEMHPLFPYLRDEASYAQLREFHYQETPLDIHFADILSLMMAGLPGPIRLELAANYWDEVGRGDLERTHRNLRLCLMRSYGISERIHLDAIETFVWEELALANLYFRSVLDRSALVQSFGIMLATEMAVPGRVEYQLEGCRRAGVPEEALAYLTEHVAVDGYHAMGWADQVVRPILRRRFDLAPTLMTGVSGRLELAAAVCDRMLSELRAPRVS